MRNFPPSRTDRLEFVETKKFRELLVAWHQIAMSTPGDVSIELQSLHRPVICRRPEVMHYAASTLKVAVLIGALAEVSAQRLDLDHPLLVNDSFTSAAGGQFTMKQKDDQDDATWSNLGKFIPLRTLLNRMITESSNIATNVVLNQITIEAVVRTLRGSSIDGLTFGHLIGDLQAMASGNTNRVSAQGLAQLMSHLARGRLLPRHATSWAIELMAAQRHRQMIPAGLPAGTWSANKPGWTDRVHHDVALVRPTCAPEYILAICTTTSPEADADALVAELSAATWEHWTSWHLK